MILGPIARLGQFQPTAGRARVWVFVRDKANGAETKGERVFVSGSRRSSWWGWRGSRSLGNGALLAESADQHSFWYSRAFGDGGHERLPLPVVPCGKRRRLQT